MASDDTHIRVPRSLHKRVKKYCDKGERRRIKWTIEDAINEHMNKLEKEEEQKED